VTSTSGGVGPLLPAPIRVEVADAMFMTARER
jgi:hypothetical protein